jgi:signal transduction histidine kinase
MSQLSDNEASAFRQFERRVVLLWTIITYVIAITSVWSIQMSEPELLRGWRAVGLAVLLIAYFLLYHLVLLPGPEVPTLRWTISYAVPQAAIVTALMALYGTGFLGLAISFTLQLMAVLPPRYWLAPILGQLILVAISFELVGDLLNGDFGLAVAIVVQVGIWTAIFGILVLLLQQRLRLARLVDELRRAQEELSRAATEAHELAILRERTRLAREMHDSLGHALVTVNVKLEVVERLYARDPERGAIELRATRDLVRQAMVDLRRSLDDLRGPIPSSRDLLVDLQRQVAEFRERAGVVVRSEVEPDVPELPPMIGTAILGLLPEALQNIERHAGAGSVEVRLAHEDGAVVLRVADDGSGIADSDLNRPGRHGITGMRERVEAVGGIFRIVLRPGGGTLVEATFPLVAPLESPAPMPSAVGDERALAGRA